MGRQSPTAALSIHSDKPVLPAPARLLINISDADIENIPEWLVGSEQAAVVHPIPTVPKGYPAHMTNCVKNSKTKKSRRPKDLIRGAKAAASASYPRHRSPIRKVLPRKSWPPIACNWRARANVWRKSTSPERGEEAGNQGASSARLLKQPQTKKTGNETYLDAHAGSTVECGRLR